MDETSQYFVPLTQHSRETMDVGSQCAVDSD
jgi:hypothetical protein